MSTRPLNQTSPATTPVFLTQKQLAARWLCSTMKLRRMHQAGKLPVHYIGRAARYKLADVEKIEAAAAA